ncbi:multidrug efflux SMR transporter [Paenibacillus sp. UNC499MF]|uniref:DMT family transporter n=1 Tax=unclassified Paenibacillus TaxID=185978 RepID=UPI0008A0152F|nr:multidrug efflux SMR transporter [Paenibacillus sp. UNC499MF]SEF88898.1 paired small multidrug resistance pump [Paenibacillus sp. UNC499MF]
MAWAALILAGCSEIFGVLAMNKIAQKKTIWAYALLFLGFGLSFSLLSYAMESIPMGTAYAVWTGIGTCGGTLLGMFMFGESKDWRRIVFIAMIISAAVGLKLLT